jgi:hypothetical protein
MSNQRHIQLERVSERITLRLKQIAGAYRLGNVTKEKALLQAEKVLNKSFNEILLYTRNVPVQRDLGKDAQELKKQDINQLRQEITKKLQDFKQILEDTK